MSLEMRPSISGGINPNQIAPQRLGLIHCHIGPFEHFFRAGFVTDEQSYADTRCATVPDSCFCRSLWFEFKSKVLSEDNADLFGDDDRL